MITEFTRNKEQGTIFAIEQLSKARGCEINFDKFRNKTNSNYELIFTRRIYAAAGDRTRDLKISATCATCATETEREGGLLCT